MSRGPFAAILARRTVQTQPGARDHQPAAQSPTDALPASSIHYWDGGVRHDLVVVAPCPISSVYAAPSHGSIALRNLNLFGLHRYFQGHWALPIAWTFRLAGHYRVPEDTSKPANSNLARCELRQRPPPAMVVVARLPRSLTHCLEVAHDEFTCERLVFRQFPSVVFVRRR